MATYLPALKKAEGWQTILEETAAPQSLRRLTKVPFRRKTCRLTWAWAATSRLLLLLLTDTHRWRASEGRICRLKCSQGEVVMLATFSSVETAAQTNCAGGADHQTMRKGPWMGLNDTRLHTSKHILGSEFSLCTSLPKTERSISVTSTEWKKYWFWFQISLCLANDRLVWFKFCFFVFSKSKAAQLKIIHQDFSKLCISLQDLLQRSIHPNTTHATGVGFLGVCWLLNTPTSRHCLLPSASTVKSSSWHTLLYIYINHMHPPGYTKSTIWPTMNHFKPTLLIQNIDEWHLYLCLYFPVI